MKWSPLFFYHDMFSSMYQRRKNTKYALLTMTSGKLKRVKNKDGLSGEINYAKRIRTIKIKPQNRGFPVSDTFTSKIKNTIFDIALFENRKLSRSKMS